MFSYFIENLSLKRESKLDNFLNKKIVPSFFVKNIQFFRAISCGCPEKKLLKFYDNIFLFYKYIILKLLSTQGVTFFLQIVSGVRLYP